MTYNMALLKILPEDRAEDFLNGSLYMNTAKYFGRIDSTDEVRFDPHDGIDERGLGSGLFLCVQGEYLDRHS